MDCRFGICDGDVVVDVLKYFRVCADGVFDNFRDLLIGGFRVREGEILQGECISGEWLFEGDEEA